jgi:hypothetical protein
LNISIHTDFRKYREIIKMINQFWIGQIFSTLAFSCFLGHYSKTSLIIARIYVLRHHDVTRNGGTAPHISNFQIRLSEWSAPR